MPLRAIQHVEPFRGSSCFGVANALDLVRRPGSCRRTSAARDRPLICRAHANVCRAQQSAAALSGRATKRSGRRRRGSTEAPKRCGMRRGGGVGRREAATEGAAGPARNGPRPRPQRKAPPRARPDAQPAEPRSAARPRITRMADEGGHADGLLPRRLRGRAEGMAAEADREATARMRRGRSCGGAGARGMMPPRFRNAPPDGSPVPARLPRPDGPVLRPARPGLRVAGPDVSVRREHRVARAARRERVHRLLDGAERGVPGRHGLRGHGHDRHDVLPLARRPARIRAPQRRAPGRLRRAHARRVPAGAGPARLLRRLRTGNAGTGPRRAQLAAAGHPAAGVLLPAQLVARGAAASPPQRPAESLHARPRRPRPPATDTIRGSSRHSRTWPSGRPRRASGPRGNTRRRCGTAR